MVGRLTLNSKVSGPQESHNSDIVNPPPPYKRKFNSPIILAETTTTRTEVVTTTTTTHFFSLPLWRKRGFHSSRSAPQNALNLGVGSDEHGSIPLSARSSAYLVEKDLPPTPPNEHEPPNDIHQGFDRNEKHNTDEVRMLPVPILPADSRKPPKGGEASTMQSTAALARAALGLGLPHVLPYASDPSSSSEINTVAFIPQTTPDLRLSSPGVRRVKSSQKFKSNSPSDWPATVPSEQDSRRRSRGFSLGSASFLDFGATDMKGKGKEKVTLEQLPPPKSISRRPSFWSRRRTIAPEPTLLPTPQDTNLIPLPSLPPVSPFEVDLPSVRPHPSPLSANPHPSNRHHSRGLSRSYSERAQSTSAKPTAEPNPNFLPISAVPKVTIPSQRVSSDQLQTEPLRPLNTSPQLDLSTQFAPSKDPSQPPRPRAYTNPLSLRTFLNATPLPAPSLSRISFAEPKNQRPHTASGNPTRHSLSKEPVDAPIPLTDTESPEVYLQRLQSAVSKAEVAGILASRCDHLFPNDFLGS